MFPENPPSKKIERREISRNCARRPNGIHLARVSGLAYAFGKVDPTAALAFVSTGAGFAIAGVPLARDAALVEAGADLQITSQAKIGLSYAGQLAGSIQDHSVKGNFTWRF